MTANQNMSYAIEFRHVSKRFADKPALQDVSFQVPAGQVFGLLGPNGAGKTTLLRILSTLLRPDTGEVWLNGINVLQSPLQARQSLGLVNANMGLYQRLTGRENLQFFAEIAGLDQAAGKARISTLMLQLDIGDWIDQRSSGYSTGMRQKIIVARAILHEPKVLVLDEASNGLDVFAKRALVNFARAYADAGNLVIYCTHILSEAEALCADVAILHEGSLLAHASMSALLQQTQAPDLEEAFFRLASAAKLAPKQKQGS